MTTRKTLKRLLLVVVMAAGLAITDHAIGQDFSLNYERLSSLEEPIATEFGDVTLVLNGLLDTALIHDAEDDGNTDAGLTANLQVSALTQLSNRWRVGLRYFGQYVADDRADIEANDGYTDNAALTVGGAWGTVLGGNVSGAVREQTRRLRGAGNASLAFDDVLGRLEERSVGYIGRFGPWVVGTVVDEDGNFDLGGMYQRPFGTRDYRLTARVTAGTYSPEGGPGRFDTWAVSGVGELVYGSMLFDIGVGHERFSRRGPDIDRWYVSSGARWKTGVVSVSLEGHYGRFEAEDEVSAALGLQYDVARGLSANLGINHANARVTRDGLEVEEVEETKTVLSFRYSF